MALSPSPRRRPSKVEPRASLLAPSARASFASTRLSSAAAGLTEQEFADAYLLNVDVAGDRLYSLKVTSVDVSDESVSVGVELTRSDKIGQAINGVLKLYGAEALSAFKNGTDAPISAAVISDETFSNGDTATGEFEIGDEAKVKFLKAKVE